MYHSSHTALPPHRGSQGDRGDQSLSPPPLPPLNMISWKEGDLGAALFLSLVLSFFGSLSCSTFNTTMTLEVLGSSKNGEGEQLHCFFNSIQRESMDLIIYLCQMKRTCVCTCEAFEHALTLSFIWP